MCVDDYQFRHVSAVRPKECRRFVFQTPEGLERVFLVNISQFERHGNLCLCEILMHLNKKGLNIKDYRFYLPKFDVAIEAGDRCQVPFETMSGKEILFEMQCLDDDNLSLFTEIYNRTPTEMDEEPAEQHHEPQQRCQTCKMEEAESLSDNQNMDEEEEYSPNSVGSEVKHDLTRKSKEQENTVAEALFKTKMWRWIHEKLNFSLKNAAGFVGISKKTLDDYFLVLRLAKLHGYDFRSNLDKKIGHMRAYIREQPIKIKGRLSKQVSFFHLVPDPDLSEITALMERRLTKSDHIEVVATCSTMSSQSHKGLSGEHEMLDQ